MSCQAWLNVCCIYLGIVKYGLFGWNVVYSLKFLGKWQMQQQKVKIARLNCRYK